MLGGRTDAANACIQEVTTGLCWVRGSRQVYRWYVETDQFVTNAVQHAYTLSAFADDSQVSRPICT